MVSPVLKERIRSIAGVPLVSTRGVLGVLHVGCVQPRRFTDVDLDLLQMVAARVALAFERADAFDALRLSEQKLRVALSAGQMGVWEWSIPTGRVTWSPALEAIHGLDPGTFPGTFEAFQRDVHPEDRDGLQRRIQEVLESRHDHRVEYRIIRPDGQVRWVSGHGSVVESLGGRPITMMGVCMDVTERKRIEQAREATAAEREETLRQNEVFAGILAHDLRNPIGAILTAAELLLARPESQGARLASPLRRIRSSGERMTRMIDQLLDFTRARVGGGFDLDRREADLATICAHVLEEIELAHPDWRVELESSATSPAAGIRTGCTRSSRTW